MTAITPIQNRYEFVYLFDVTQGNPNGDPDAGNMPRVDYADNHGFVTDVSLKRKVRNFVDLVRPELKRDGLEIYVREKGVLNNEHRRAYQALGEEPKPKKLPKDQDKARRLTEWMCANFFDVRTFGAVMTTEVNCGQVRGPIQLAFARSVDPVVPREIPITRMAVTKEEDVEKERTMGRKYIVPYGLYRAEGFISAPLAGNTGFSDTDLELFWQALKVMFDHDRSAARGKMGARKLIAFKHANRLGNAPAQVLFDAVKTERITGTPGEPALGFGDYRIEVDRAKVPEGVEVLELL